MGAPARVTGFPRLPETEAQESGKAIEDTSLSPLSAESQHGTAADSRTLQSKYLEVMQSGDGDPLTPVNHRITKPGPAFGT